MIGYAEMQMFFIRTSSSWDWPTEYTSLFDLLPFTREGLMWGVQLSGPCSVYS
jgi:hypothetical protein